MTILYILPMIQYGIIQINFQFLVKLPSRLIDVIDLL